MEVIKESDINKYFGDSNAGSAYVLYYQAVDLDLGALGLRPAVVGETREGDEVEREREKVDEREKEEMRAINSTPSE